MMQIEQTNCKNCGAPLSGGKFVKCAYCGTVYERKEEEVNIKLEIDAKELFAAIQEHENRLFDSNIY